MAIMAVWDGGMVGWWNLIILVEQNQTTKLINSDLFFVVSGMMECLKLVHCYDNDLSSNMQIQFYPTQVSVHPT